MVRNFAIRLPSVPPTNDLLRLGGNIAGQYKRAAALALHVGIGNVAGIAASNIYRAKDAPRYRLGRKLHTHFVVGFRPLTPSTDAIELGLVGMGLIVLPIMVVTYKRINAQREATMKETAGESGGSQHTDEELRRMGDKAPNFQYGI